MNSLSSEEALQRQKKYGPNEITDLKKRSSLKIFLNQFKSPLVFILIFASILSGFLAEWVESLAIASILVLNAVIGFFQEFRAENAIQALRSITAPRAKVIRDNRQLVILARDVVPGDHLLLEAGDIVAADSKLINCSRFQVNESVLTGESMPVEKDLNSINHIFMGTSVVTGTATAQVLAIGMSTELGKIAHLITTAKIEKPPLQIQLEKVGKILLWICLAIAVFITCWGLIQDRPWLELIIFSISLAVAAVPEGLPVIVTVAIALGVQRMASRKALVRQLPSVETLGSVSVICTDKTGTLTTGKMRIREIWGKDHDEILKVAASCCDAELNKQADDGTGDPTEIAILIDAYNRGFFKDEIEKNNPRLETFPFDSQRKRMSVYRSDQILYVKGALESIHPLLEKLSPEESHEISKANHEMSSQGYRVLAVATGKSKNESSLNFVGLIGISDPPRLEVYQAISDARAAGITIVMITGDHPVTAHAIAKELGLVLESEDTSNRIHARATPEQKLMLIRQWKDRGAIVAMTGDGVNDAPALREAHIGIAMGKSGTEVTKQSADIILADDNFATIIHAVEQGRGVYKNIQKAIVFLLSGNFGELISVVGAMLLGLPSPFLAVQLLWINLVTDSLPGLALIADPVGSHVLKQPPRSTLKTIIGRAEWFSICLVGLLEACVVLAVFATALETTSKAQARGLAFTALVFCQLFRSLGARSKEKFFWELGIISNLWLIAVIIFTGILQISLHYIPLSQKALQLSPFSTKELTWIFIVSLIPFTFIEVIKFLRRFRLFKKV